MRKFKDLDEVEEWLAPMDFAGFWFAVEPLELTLQDRGHCDEQIKRQEVDEKLILGVLKSMARMEIGERQGLRWRAPTPWVKAV